MADKAVRVEKDLELRNITLDPRHGPALDFLLVTGTNLPGAHEICQRLARDFGMYFLDTSEYIDDLRDIGKHDRAVYGHVHPSAFRKRFYDRLTDATFVDSTAFTFFLLAMLKYQIDLEIALRACREFAKQVRVPRS